MCYTIYLLATFFILIPPFEPRAPAGRLSARPIPHLDAAALSAQFTAPSERSQEQAAAHALTGTLTGEVLSADTVLTGLPLYDFGPPSTFKAWFDRIASEQTIGKLSDKTFVVVTARGGGGYGPGTPGEGWDHREPWLRHALSAPGVEDPSFVDAELTLAP